MQLEDLNCDLQEYGLIVGKKSPQACDLLPIGYQIIHDKGSGQHIKLFYRDIVLAKLRCQMTGANSQHPHKFTYHWKWDFQIPLTKELKQLLNYYAKSQNMLDASAIR